MEADKSPSFQQAARVKLLQKQRRKRKQDSLGLAQMLLIIWIVGAFTVVLVVYLLTKDPTVIVFWTSCTGLATVVLSALFQRKE